MRRRLTAVLWLAGLTPLVWTAWQAWAGGLGVNPIETVTDRTGTGTVICLCLTLAVTPFRKALGWGWLAPQRRTFGLLTFTYAISHFLTWLVLDQFFFWPTIVEDIAERPFITVGFTAFLLLIPLAVTSTNGWVRRLGGRRWARLHRLVYLVAILAAVHFTWSVKRDATEPLSYTLLLALLLGFRLLPAGSRRREPAKPTAGAAR